MLRRLHALQPTSFAFTPANLAWAEQQIAKFPKGREASAVIPLLWRAQEQEGWLSRAAIEEVARMVGLAYIRALEVATFYYMFQLSPVGSVAHVQVCGTTSCMICGAEDLIGVCRDKIAAVPHALSPDGRFSWEEVECLGACANAPMAQIGKDYYEDLTAESLAGLIDAFARGEVPRPGPQNGRFASEPHAGLTSLAENDRGQESNASVTLAAQQGDTLRRITGDEPEAEATPAAEKGPEVDPRETSDRTEEPTPQQPPGRAAPEAGAPDDLTLIEAIDAAVANRLHGLGIYHFRQIADWTPAEVAWIDANLEGHGGRAMRDGWVEQARQLAENSDTPHAHEEINEDVDNGRT